MVLGSRLRMTEHALLLFTALVSIVRSMVHPNRISAAVALLAGHRHRWQGR